MGKAPRQPEAIFDSFINDYRDRFGPELISIVLYGSSARGKYVPKQSDINFLIILTELGMSNLGKALPLVSKWRKRGISVPLILAESYIISSLKDFPIEFLAIRSSHQIIYGKDIIAHLDFDKRHVRYQCEREAKGKLLQLREHFLETGGNARRIEALVIGSLPSFLSLFQAVIFILDLGPVTDMERLITLVSRAAGMEKELFRDLMAISRGRKKITAGQAVPLMEAYIEQIRKLAGFTERIEIAEEP